MGKLINECDTEARVNDESKKKASEIGNKVVDKILEKHAPDLKALKDEVTKANEVKKEVSELHDLIKTGSDYSKLSNAEKLKFDRDLALKLNEYGNANELSKAFTRDATGRIIDVNKSALADLDRQLNQLNDQTKPLNQQTKPFNSTSRSISSESASLNSCWATEAAENGGGTLICCVSQGSCEANCANQDDECARACARQAVHSNGRTCYWKH
jgi:hypothetical protein